MPIETKVTKYFVHNLKRIAAAFSLYSPKYANRHHRFNFTYDTLDYSKPIIRSYYLYNQPCSGSSGTSGMRAFIGKRGLACVLYDVYSNEENSVDNLYDYHTDPKLFEKLVQVTFDNDDSKSLLDHSGYSKFVNTVLVDIFL